MEEKEKAVEKPAGKEKNKSLAKRLQKAALSRAMKYVQSPKGMATFNKLMDAKKKTDNRISALYEAAGLPSLRGKHQVEWAVDRQAKRIRDLTGELDQIEDSLNRLEKAIAADVAPPPAEPIALPPSPIEPSEPVPTEAVAPAPKAKKSTKKTPVKKAPVKKAPAKKAPAKTAKAKAPAKPKPLRAANMSMNAAARKSLLDLNWKGKPKRK